MKKCITLTIDEDIWRDFTLLESSDPDKRFVSKSQAIEDFIKAVLTGELIYDAKNYKGARIRANCDCQKD